MPGSQPYLVIPSTTIILVVVGAPLWNGRRRTLHRSGRFLAFCRFIGSHYNYWCIAGWGWNCERHCISPASALNVDVHRIVDDDDDDSSVIFLMAHIIVLRGVGECDKNQNFSIQMLDFQVDAMLK